MLFDGIWVFVGVVILGIVMFVLILFVVCFVWVNVIVYMSGMIEVIFGGFD